MTETLPLTSGLTALALQPSLGVTFVVLVVSCSVNPLSGLPSHRPSRSG